MWCEVCICEEIKCQLNSLRQPSRTELLVITYAPMHHHSHLHLSLHYYITKRSSTTARRSQSYKMTGVEAARIRWTYHSGVTPTSWQPWTLLLSCGRCQVRASHNHQVKQLWAVQGEGQENAWEGQNDTLDGMQGSRAISVCFRGGFILHNSHS